MTRKEAENVLGVVLLLRVLSRPNLGPSSTPPPSDALLGSPLPFAPKESRHPASSIREKQFAWLTSLSDNRPERTHKEMKQQRPERHIYLLRDPHGGA